ncbi:ABA4-like family protein [Aquimarina macrocephali]|uniref:ABA4-like family protein n=1 Tax=Aquimarina macrocephali TaxID=666563 RepID=UPI003F67261C
MTPTEVFSISSMIAMPMWILMILFPNWKATRFLIDFKVVPILLSFIYVFYIFKTIQIGGGIDFGSLTSVMALFTEENAVLAGWVHYLAFDLLVGMWMLDQNKGVKIHQLIMAPCLFATFMLGPIGFLLFIIIRAFKQKQS